MMDVSLKLREKESVLRFKNGSPKLKDVLRKKCRERLQRNRNDFIDKLRNLDGDTGVKEELTNMMKEDLKTMYTTLNNNTYESTAQAVEEEVLDEELEWLMSQYDMIFDNEAYLMEMFESLNEVVCPICQKCALVVDNNGQRNSVTCLQCQYSINSSRDLLQLKEDIMSCLDEHNSNCNMDPHFNLLSDFAELHIYMICCHCSVFSMVI